MKKLLFFACILITGFSFSQNRNIKIQRQFLISEVSSVTARTADSALNLVSLLFNSKEFQDSVLKLTFPYQNTCNYCDHSRPDPTKMISGKDILNSIFRQANVMVKLRLLPVGKKPKPWNCKGLGNTCPDTDSITSYFANIQCDMGSDFPFQYGYAVHLAHEFTHNVGYCHTTNDVKDDIAEAIGWIAFHFIRKWHIEHRI